MSLSRTLFSWPMKEHKKCRREDVHVGRTDVGAACSAYRTLAYEPTHGAETCPALGYHLTFSPTPQKVSGKEGADVYPKN